MPAISNISIARISDVIGQFVTPQNTLTMAAGGTSPAGRPKNPDKKLPSVAPIKSVGTIHRP